MHWIKIGHRYINLAQATRAMVTQQDLDVSVRLYFNNPGETIQKTELFEDGEADELLQALEDVCES